MLNRASSSIIPLGFCSHAAVDEAMDVFKHSQQATTVVHPRITSSGIETETAHLGVSRLLRGDAEHVAENTCATLKKWGTKASQLVNFTSDGCLVYQGHKSGACTRIHKSFYWLALVLHCIHHRLSLAMKSAAKSVACMQKWWDIFEELGRHCDFSARRTSQHTETQISRGEQPLRMLTTAVTRWLTQDNGTRGVYDRLGSICLDLTIRGDGDDGDRAPEDGTWILVPQARRRRDGPG